MAARQDQASLGNVVTDDRALAARLVSPARHVELEGELLIEAWRKDEVGELDASGGSPPRHRRVVHHLPVDRARAVHPDLGREQDELCARLQEPEVLALAESEIALDGGILRG